MNWAVGFSCLSSRVFKLIAVISTVTRMTEQGTAKRLVDYLDGSEYIPSALSSFSRTLEAGVVAWVSALPG